PATLTPEEEHRYRSTACPIEETLIDQLSDLTDRVREAAIEQAWSVDWTELADHRRKLAASRGPSRLVDPARARRDHRHAWPGRPLLPQELWRGQCVLKD